MKKFLSLLLCCLIMVASALSVAAYADEPLSIVTTIFPPYDFVRAIAGDVPVDLKMLLAPGAESHSFEPSPQDIIAIENSDIFIHAGGEGDAWVDRILESLDTSAMTVLTMTDMVQTVSEEFVEGMEHSHDHGHEEAPFDPAKVYGRELSEWTGAWKSLAPAVSDGTLDAYIQAKADEGEISFEEQKETLAKRWATEDFQTFLIAGDTLYIDTGDATLMGAYTNEGFKIIERDDGSASVWYQYALAGDAPGMPRYIVFNDHGYGTPPEGTEADEHAHDHGVAHTHFKYGDTSLDKVIDIEGWNTFFVDAGATDEEILDTLMGHDSHDHSHEAEFTLADIKDRTLTDWAGDWQSVYPYLLDGTLDPVMEHKAESGDKTAQEYKEEYDAHYVTDVNRVVIDDSTMTFYRGDTAATAEYTYRGTGVLDGSKGYWVRYKFEAVNPAEGTPRYIMFSDHLHAPQKTAHFHIYASDESFDALMADGNPVNYPTYYAMDMTGEQIVQELIAHDSSDSHAHEMDEHVWTSPVNAQAIATAIAGVMMEKDSAGADAYAANLAAFTGDLQALDAAFRDVVAGATRKTVLFGDRFPFRYLTDAYGLDYYAAFSGCSTSTDASAGTIAFLIDKAKAENIPVVFKIELSNGHIAQAIAESTGAKVLEMHSAHNLTKADFDAGVTYLDVMRRNVEQLKEALQ